MRKATLRLLVLTFVLATAAVAGVAPTKSAPSRTCGRCPTGTYCCVYHGGLCLPNGFPCP
jgi:hypothetical protein